MTPMNTEWAIGKLKAFLETASITFIPDGPNSFGFWQYKLDKPKAEVQAAAQIIELILDRVLPGWRTAQWDKPDRQPYWREREAANRAIAQLEAQQELEENLGSGAPQLDAATMHPWVWGSVQGLWSSGHYREAVGVAAKAINAQAQAKLGRKDISEAKLIGEAFSMKPPASGSPRLRIGVEDGSDTYRNRNEGAAAFARGVYSAIRNPIAHEIDDELNENEALEQLAAFSILARWIDDARVETAG
ncbi:TIGR02391 family protein [Streptomyces sp. PSKA54]|uniref:TIGR02391 family protein n=1 Tax=Streptomyces himalayensis subsp. aureolus TaxID=2758039 RepID=A0A7W2HJK9_9ACTN|nr:TIGR02391 family protein [Streptomyces himalayensis]MBA4865949.1 TIGR02391 family protein [Streptomyces himalayensis subsp. aureolus]